MSKNKPSKNQCVNLGIDNDALRRIQAIEDVKRARKNAKLNKARFEFADLRERRAKRVNKKLY